MPESAPISRKATSSEKRTKVPPTSCHLTVPSGASISRPLSLNLQPPALVRLPDSSLPRYFQQASSNLAELPAGFFALSALPSPTYNLKPFSQARLLDDSIHSFFVSSDARGRSVTALCTATRCGTMMITLTKSSCLVKHPGAVVAGPYQTRRVARARKRRRHASWRDRTGRTEKVSHTTSPSFFSLFRSSSTRRFAANAFEAMYRFFEDQRLQTRPTLLVT